MTKPYKMFRCPNVGVMPYYNTAKEITGVGAAGLIELLKTAEIEEIIQCEFENLEFGDVVKFPREDGTEALMTVCRYGNVVFLPSIEGDLGEGMLFTGMLLDGLLESLGDWDTYEMAERLSFFFVAEKVVVNGEEAGNIAHIVEASILDAQRHYDAEEAAKASAMGEKNEQQGN